MFEFDLDSITDSGLLQGRNGKRDIPVGTMFTEVRRHRRSSNSSETQPAEVVCKIALSIRAVHFYQEVIDVVPGDHTAALAVDGDGMHLLAEAINHLSKDDYLSLFARAI
jgi:hypothetical protein